MADELLRSKHAFGALERVLEAISSGAINAYDILFLKDKNGKPYIGWVDKDNQPVILQDEKEIITVSTLPTSGETGKLYIYESDGYFWNGTEFINLCKQTDVSALEEELKKLKTDVELLKTEISKKADMDACENTHLKVKYEVSDVPTGTLINYREDEIRIMCPKDTVFTKQSVGVGDNPNSYYITFKTYYPNKDVVGYIEHLGDQVDPEILTESSTDKYGRVYQSTWLALADYDATTESWTYRGKESSKDDYYGYDYQIDWYDANGVMIGSDSIRINLSNEECHYISEPYYVASANAEIVKEAVTESKTYTNEQIAELLKSFAIVEF